MPLISIEEIKPGVKLGLWRMEPCAADMLKRYPTFADLVDDKMKPNQRMLERLSVAALVREMTGCDTPRIEHLPNGAPTFDGYHISISHTRGFAAVILSTEHEVAVDIEYPSDRVERIASKFIRPDEQADSIERMLVNWCAKETVYKLLNSENLHYFDMRVLPYEIRNTGTLCVENLKRSCLVNVVYRQTGDYFITFSCLSPIS